MTKTVENSYPEDNQQETKQEIPIAIKIHIAIFAIVVGLQLISGIFEAVVGGPLSHFSLVFWSIFAGIFFILYAIIKKEELGKNCYRHLDDTTWSNFVTFRGNSIILFKN